MGCGKQGMYKHSQFFAGGPNPSVAVKEQVGCLYAIFTTQDITFMAILTNILHGLFTNSCGNLL